MLRKSRLWRKNGFLIKKTCISSGNFQILGIVSLTIWETKNYLEALKSLKDSVHFF